MNTTSYLQKTAVAAFALTLLLQGSLSWADDTEMYFGQIPSDIKPNVFFILDDSGSMDWCLDANPPRGNQRNYVCKNGPTRMSVLKQTMIDLINDTSGINIGLMTLRREQSLEVKDIDAGQQRATALARINAMRASGGTPIAKALYDAARYFNGFPSNHNSYEAIRVTANSPIIDECQPSHFVLLTDGQANSHNATIKNNMQNLIGGGFNCPNRGDETCVVELAKWMHDNDQSPHEQTPVTTHTIGFALEADTQNKESIKKFLKEVAEKGGGSHYTADTAPELAYCF